MLKHMPNQSTLGPKPTRARQGADGKERRNAGGRGSGKAIWQTRTEREQKVEITKQTKGISLPLKCKRNSNDCDSKAEAAKQEAWRSSSCWLTLHALKHESGTFTTEKFHQGVKWKVFFSVLTLPLQTQYPMDWGTEPTSLRFCWNMSWEQWKDPSLQRINLPTKNKKYTA